MIKFITLPPAKQPIPQFHIIAQISAPSDSGLNDRDLTNIWEPEN